MSVRDTPSTHRVQERIWRDKLDSVGERSLYFPDGVMEKEVKNHEASLKQLLDMNYRPTDTHALMREGVDYVGVETIGGFQLAAMNTPIGYLLSVRWRAPSDEKIITHYETHLFKRDGSIDSEKYVITYEKHES